MRRISRWIFVRNAMKCGELFFHRIHRFHRISYIILPQELMRWIFGRNAVNFAVKFCKKCGEIFVFTAFTAIIAFLTKIHRIHRISYKNLPKNLDPGSFILEYRSHFELVFRTSKPKFYSTRNEDRKLRIENGVLKNNTWCNRC